jgi:AAA domain
MISLANIRETTAMLPPRVLIHGLEGVGKTTLAAKFPKPVFLQTEDGTPTGLKVATFGLLSSHANIREALVALCNEPHEFCTAVVDSLDRLEGRIWADVCETNHWPSIEAPGYGRGYVIADKWWRDFLAGLDWLRRERGMTTVLLAHSAVDPVNDPRAPAYTSYQLRLHKRARGLVQDEVDVIGFLATDVAVVSEDAGFNKKRTRAEGGAARWLHFEGRPAFVAKSRFELPPKLLCPKDFDVSTSLASIFPKVAPGAKVRSTLNKEASHG